MKFGFRGEEFENVDNTHTPIHLHTYGRKRPTYTISSPMSLKAQVSLKSEACLFYPLNLESK